MRGFMSRVQLLTWGPHVHVVLSTLLCTEQLPVMPSYLQQISVNFNKILQCEREILFSESGSAQMIHFNPTPTHSNPYLYRICSAPPHYLIQSISTHPNTLHIKTEPINPHRLQSAVQMERWETSDASGRSDWYLSIFFCFPLFFSLKPILDFFDQFKSFGQ